MDRQIVYIGFGSNVGDRLHYCDRAVALLGLLPFSQPSGVSSYYETEPVCDVGDPGPGWFLNGVVRLETELPVHRVLDITREIERALGRDGDRDHGPRTIDLDILFYGSETIESDGLVIPHPRLHLRRFVLTPLVELDPGWKHPILRATAKELLDRLDDSARVRRMTRLDSSIGPRAACTARTPGA